MKLFLTVFILFISLNMHTEAFANTPVEEALHMQLAITDNRMPDEALQLQKEMTAKITKAAYGDALEIAMLGLKKFPQNFLLQTYFAMIMGDYAEQIATPIKGKMIKKSQFVFKKLMNEISDQPQSIVFYFKNEYYFRFAQYKHQYETGLARVAAFWGTKDWSTKGFGYYPQGIGGYYSQGVGASNYARELFKNGDKKLARVYAQKALIAW